MIYDLSSFNWNRWKKCINKVITDYPENLLFESDPQGEKALRYEISFMLASLSESVMSTACFFV